MLKDLVNRLEHREAIMCSELEKLEEPAKNSLEACRDSLRCSPVAQSCLTINERLNRTEEFGNMLIGATKSSSTALYRLQCSLKVVDMVSQLYDLGSSILSNFQKGENTKGTEDATAFITAVNKAKVEGYWEEVSKVIARGYINQVISDLRTFIIHKLRSQMSSDESQLFMRLAVTLQASSEAYQAYLKTIHEKTQALQTCRFVSNHNDNDAASPREGGQTFVIEKIIKNARNLLLRQAQAVHSELGSTDYIRICREIHAATSTQACDVLAVFIRTNFAGFISNPEVEIEDMLAQVSAVLEEQHVLFEYVDDMKKADKVLDDIATINALWTDYEGSLRELLTPTYRTLILQSAAEDEEFSTDVLGQNSKATQALQSLLILYVRLEHASVTRGLIQAIKCDSIDLTAPDDGFAVATSTLVDDIFFVLQKAQQRAVATGDVQAACATLNQVNGIIQGDLRNALVQNLLDSQRIYTDYLENPDNLISGSWYSMLEEYFARSKHVLPESLASKYSFIHCINNIEECLNFLPKFKCEISDGFNREFIKDGKTDLLVENTLESMDYLINDYEQLMETACKYALSILKYHLTDPLNRFNEINFTLNEEAYASYQSESPFVDDMINILRMVFGHFSTFYAPIGRSKCIGNLIERICQFMETSIMDKRFTIYGAVYLDSTIRALMQLCTSYDQQTRQHFATLLLISDVVNCAGREELVQFEGEAPSDALQKYFALRTDIAPE